MKEGKVEILQRDGDYLVSHGSYIDDWRDDKGLIFDTVMKLTDASATRFVAEAMANINFDNLDGAATADERAKENTTAEHVNPRRWMIPSNKGFVIFRVDHVFNRAYGLYRHDYSMWLIKAEVYRLEAAHRRFYGNVRLGMALGLED